MALIIQSAPGPSVCGEGITRTSNPKATFWKFKITWPHTAAHMETIKALNEDQALSFLNRRYPEAIHFALITDLVKPFLGVGGKLIKGKLVPYQLCKKSQSEARRG